ncbi:hypothetical protein AKJ41_00170 [candidate division MSBL1 archaeon SCGC-AAA259O05]|uniref:Fe/B12 periplasmic-binding domain-containing protein n=1 Tax=candidate division MSBL1 archaeon SCGC-AAA259O05 TaxID=1698271 RepID=A0A133V5X1_9EURY|nr:hypothetical protein AKJ41_00170 [candidate division MSBL1 archaeon SCGC-AAA259O05]
MKEISKVIPGELLDEIAHGGYPRTITDDRGKEITISEEPGRIVSLSPSTTETLFALHLDNLVVGVTKYCDYPPRAKNMKEENQLSAVGGYTTFSVEKITSLNPDLVLAGSYESMPKERIRKLEKLGLKVICLDAKNISDAIGDMRLIGRACGCVSRAESLTENLSEEINSVAGKAQNLSENERPKVFWQSWWSPIYSAGSKTFANKIIEASGGRNIFADEEGWVSVGKETIISRNPEVYITTPHSGRTVEEVKNTAGFGEVSAVEDNRVYEVPEDIFSRPGPRIADAVKVLAYLLHPDMFKKPSLPYAEVPQPGE